METICAILNEKKDVLKELDEKVITLCEITDIEREIEEADEVMSRILDIQRIICEKSKQKIAHAKSKTRQEVSPPNPSPVDETTTNSESSTGTLNSVQSQSLNNVSNDSASTNDGERPTFNLLQFMYSIHSKYVRSYRSLFCQSLRGI